MVDVLVLWVDNDFWMFNGMFIFFFGLWVQRSDVNVFDFFFMQQVSDVMQFDSVGFIFEEGWYFGVKVVL